MAGDLAPGRAMIWSRVDRPARMHVRWGTRETDLPNRVRGPHCLDVTDFTGRIQIENLPPGQRIFYRVEFEDLAAKNSFSEPVFGSFKTAPAVIGSDVTLLWGGDTAGQGYGINPDTGGMRTYQSMARANADLFIHSGDTIYADGPIPETIRLKDGTLWRNVVTPEKSKAAETLAEFRGAYKYNLLDDHVRRFNASIAQLWQWDDHEVLNNWSSSKDLSGDKNYQEKSVPTLVGRATRAFLEYAPMQYHPGETERVYRKVSYGPLVDVFLLDQRSYRGPNTHNRQPAESAETAFLGAAQSAWLVRELQASKAIWKVIAADMPIGLLVPDGRDEEGRPRFEAIANGPGEALGRELELARLLRAMRSIPNVVWITADVHYTAAHHYHPDRAKFKDFRPFWEFVAGPLHAGTFGPGTPDETFGIAVDWFKAPPKGESNLPPSEGYQFFGELKFLGASRDLVVTLRDLEGTALYSKRLPVSLS